MPKLVLLNGPPGIGKSTLARRYAADHPHWQVVEQDDWHAEVVPAVARERAVDHVHAYLTAGRDVLVPQFVARPDHLDRLAALAGERDAAYVELVLLADADVAERRFRMRPGGPVIEDYAAELDRLVGAIAGRRLRTVDATDLDDAYRQLVVWLRAPRRSGGNPMTRTWS